MGKTQAGRDADTHICLWGPTRTHTHKCLQSWSQSSISLPTDPHSSLVVSLELSRGCGGYCPSDPNESVSLPLTGKPHKYADMQNIFFYSLFSCFSLSFPLSSSFPICVFSSPHLPWQTPSETVSRLLPSPQVLISTICWTRSVFWAQFFSLSLSLLLTLPILTSMLHNSDDSVGTGCICSSLFLDTSGDWCQTCVLL